MVAWSSSLPSDISPEIWNRALIWAQGHAEKSLTETDQARVAQAYLAHQHRRSRRVGIHEMTTDGRRVLFGLLGRNVYALEAGVIWGFSMSFQDEGRLSTARSIGRALWCQYLAHRARPDVRALRMGWELGLKVHHLPNHHESQLKQQIERWVKEDVEEVFDRVHLPFWQDDGLETEQIEKDRKVQALKTEATLAYRHQMNRVLHTLRRALPRPVREALWGHRAKALVRADLAHWLMKAGPEHVTYRGQALRQQPVLLPLALQASGQWPVRFSSPAAAHRACLQPQLDRGEAMSAAIDQGRPWEEHMVTILQRGKKEAWLLHGYGAWRDHALTMPGLQVTVPLARHMRRVTQCPPFIQTGVYGPQAIEGWLHAWAALSQPRRPTSPPAHLQLCRVLGRLIILLTHHSARPENLSFPIESNGPAWLTCHLNGFVKGLPEDWAHPGYEALMARWPNLLDTLGWMGVPVEGRSRATIGTVLARLTWQQWNNFVDRAHDLERAMRPSFTREEGDQGLTWPGGRKEPVWESGHVCIHELLDEEALEEEGRQMNHCVGGYGLHCASGDVREFSVRHGDGTRLSTLEVVWDKEQAEVKISQHLTAGNQPPPAVAVTAVEHFLADFHGWRPGPWVATAEYVRRLEQVEAHQVKHTQSQRALSQRLWEEMDRRYPETKRPIASPLRPLGSA